MIAVAQFIPSSPVLGVDTSRRPVAVAATLFDAPTHAGDRSSGPWWLLSSLRYAVTAMGLGRSSASSEVGPQRLRTSAAAGYRQGRRASKYNALPLRLHRFIHPVFVVVVVDDERRSAQRSLTAAWKARLTVMTAKTVAIRAPQRPGQLPVGRPSWHRNWPPDTAIPPEPPSHPKRLPLSSRHRRR